MSYWGRAYGLYMTRSYRELWFYAMELESMLKHDVNAQASDHWHDEAERLRVERDNLRERVRELEERLETAERLRRELDEKEKDRC